MSYIRAIRSSDLSASEKLTAIMIASHYDFTKGDPAWPSNKTLAKETGLSIRTIVRAKGVLSDRQYLVSRRQYNNVTMYTPCVPVTIPYSHNGQLNTHINTHINTNINTHRNNKVSNETLDTSISNTKVNILDTNTSGISFDIDTERSSPADIKKASDLIDWFG